MYEIWLALNIVWEIALAVWPWLAAGLVVWLALLKWASARGVLWASGFRRAMILGAVVAIVSFLILPWLTRSSLSELNYWVDWANLAAVAMGFGAAAAALFWPLVSPSRRFGA